MKSVIEAKEGQFEGFVQAWLDAWNAHAIDPVISHYAEDTVVRSPFLLAAMPGSGGVVTGRERLRDIYSRAFEKYPDLHFELISYFVSTESVVILYRSVEGLIAAETFHLDEHMQARQVFCHYSTDQAKAFPVGR